jgi:hypothetical protein
MLMCVVAHCKRADRAPNVIAARRAHLPGKELLLLELTAPTFLKTTSSPTSAIFQNP